MIFVIGWKSMMLAATCLPHDTRLTDNTCSIEGAAPIVLRGHDRYLRHRAPLPERCSVALTKLALFRPQSPPIWPPPYRRPSR
jgi:hypothetical protein